MLICGKSVLKRLILNLYVMLQFLPSTFTQNTSQAICVYQIYIKKF